MQFWNELEGQTINGRYPLLRLVRSEGRSAWFETETGHPQNARATVSVTEALTDADEVTARLQAAQQVKHPNLVEITQVGQVSLDGTLMVYALMEPIEQSLSDVLQSQALSPEEGREVAEALVGALTAIHQTGMSHGHVEAASVLATEETVKLRSDCLQTSTASQAEDVAGIGTTLFHAFTQRKALTATDAQINRIPAPFAEIIRNSFARRWTLAQIGNALKPVLPVATVVPVATPPPVPTPPPPPPPPPPAPPAPTPAPPPAPAEVVLQPEPVLISVEIPEEKPPAPPVATEPLLVASEMDELEPAKKTPIALYAVLAVLVLAILGWLFFRPSSTPAPASPPTEAAAPAPVPVPKPAPTHAPAAAPGTPDARSVWRVVAYTYRSETLAQDMVSVITKKHADLGAAVFKPKGKGTAYLVTVGGAMEHDAAAKMISKAKREGLPQDTYMQNFSE
jgi:hypothetical protein